MSHQIIRTLDLDTVPIGIYDNKTFIFYARHIFIQFSCCLNAFFQTAKRITFWLDQSDLFVCFFSGAIIPGTGMI